MFYNAPMRRAAIRAVVIGVVATYLACPVLQMFDHWDHAEAQGKDTESTAMVVAMSVGLGMAATGWVIKAPVIHKPVVVPVYSSWDSPAPAVANVPIPVSQPPPVLRI